MAVYCNNKIKTSKPIAYEVNDGCWICTSHKTRTKYGYTRLRSGYLHRLVYEAEKGLIESGNVVMHKCDNPSCFNPDHLVQGTQADNVRDMQDKGRGRRAIGYTKLLVDRSNNKGVDNHTAKLDDDKVREIINLHSTGNYKHKELSVMYGVSQSVIASVVNRRSWKHVEI